MLFFFRNKKTFNNLQESRLFDETSFYKQFIKDLLNSKNEVIIESPYITSYRMETFIPVFKELINKCVKIHIITRDPIEHDDYFKYQATNEILYCNEIGIKITLLKGNHHRKLAIIDKKILWEGSLNILSQNNSIEVMRRIKNVFLSKKMMSFLRIMI